MRWNRDVTDRPGIHARGLEHRREAARLRERDGIAVRLRNVEKHLAAADGRDQGVEHGLGGRAVIGNQRADLEALAAGADHAPRRERAVAHQRAPDMAAGADPGAQEVEARRREHRRVVGRNDRERDVGKRNRAGARAAGRDAPAMADIAIREREAGFPVVVLLRDDAVETDRARAGMRDRGLPDAPSQSRARAGPAARCRSRGRRSGRRS